MDAESPEFSPSATAALRWAIAAAACRLAGPDGNLQHQMESLLGTSPQGHVELADVLIGVLLAHPDPDGEGRVLLSHFDLTARDVLPDDYPELNAGGLEEAGRRVGHVSVGDLPSLAEVLSTITITVASGGTIRLQHLLGALLSASDPGALRWSSAFASRGYSWTRVQDAYRTWLAGEDDGTAVPSKNPTAERGGVRLRTTLGDHLPRGPVPLPRYASDQVDGANDLVGISAETDAFARLIASRDLQPPLAIGLFGDWGSGKSFLIDAVQRRIDALRNEAEGEPQHEVTVWKRTVQVEFNAWEYVQGSLWAGLLERIFATLGTVQNSRLEVQRRSAEEDLERAKATLAEQNRLVDRQFEEQRRQAKMVDAARSTVEAEAARVDERAELARKEKVEKAVAGIWGPLARFAFGQRQAQALARNLADAGSELSRVRMLAAWYWYSPWHLVTSTIGAFLVPLVAWLLTLADATAPVSLLGGLAAAVPVVTATLSHVTNWTRERLDEIEAAEAEVRAVAEAPLVESREQLRTAEGNLAVTEKRLAQLIHELDVARAERERIASTLSNDVILVDYANRRSVEYRKQLGLLADVRTDLREVQDIIERNNHELRAGNATAHRQMPNRLVLYIDDLDRCPPDKVLEVLEAVHLLLSFRMFVVVVAVDSRWLQSALTDRLVALRPCQGPDHPTAIDYLEKIFQLPFWVQPISAEGRAQLMHGLLKDSVTTSSPTNQEAVPYPPSGLPFGDPEAELFETMLIREGTEHGARTSPLAMSSADLRFMARLAPLVGDTPRRVKRFVNIVQFLYAMSPPLATDTTPSDRAVVALHAALSEGTPSIAPLLTAADPALATLGDLVKKPPVTPIGRSPLPADEVSRLERWLEENPGWSTLPLSRFAVRGRMVSRLRFQRPEIDPTL